MPGPISSHYLFDALKDRKALCMACNARIGLVIPGIMRAARDANSAVILELAKSESDLNGGYTGMTPAEFSRQCREAADAVDWEYWALHADHLPIKKGTQEDMDSLKKLIRSQIENGYTSFAIDASFLFDSGGKTVAECLKKNIECTTHMALWLHEEMKGKPYGLEVEVGEVGWKDANGMILTKPEEATTFIKALNENGVHPHVIATSNGSAHGNTFDEHGNPIQQVSINIPRTIEIGRALKDMGSNVRIAQHGTTGTPRDLIATKFPLEYISKANVGTFWMNLIWDAFKVFEPELFADIWSWTLENYGNEPGMKSEQQVFGKYSKFAIKEFYERIYDVREDTKRVIDATAYAETLTWFKAFHSFGSASWVQEEMRG